MFSQVKKPSSGLLDHPHGIYFCVTRNRMNWFDVVGRVSSTVMVPPVELGTVETTSVKPVPVLQVFRSFETSTIYVMSVSAAGAK